MSDARIDEIQAYLGDRSDWAAQRCLGGEVLDDVAYLLMRIAELEGVVKSQSEHEIQCGILLDKDAKIKDLEEESAGRLERMEWTVTDNAKKAIELADLKNTLGHLRETADTHCGFDRGTDSFGDVTALGQELDRLKSELQKRDGISGTPRVGKL
jgi:hypothetical protein